MDAVQVGSGFHGLALSHYGCRPFGAVMHAITDFGARSYSTKSGRCAIELQARAPEPGPNAIQPCEPGNCGRDILVAHASCRIGSDAPIMRSMIVGTKGSAAGGPARRVPWFDRSAIPTGSTP